MLDGHVSYQSMKYLYIDDPISSLDDNNAIAVARDLVNSCGGLRGEKTRSGAPAARSRVKFSSHHALFFNVMCNELRPQMRVSPVHPGRYFCTARMGWWYTLRATGTRRFPTTWRHWRSCSGLQSRWWQALRLPLQCAAQHHGKTASFFGHADISFCLGALGTEDVALYNRALNLLSHGKYAIHEPTEMGEDNQELFRRILQDFVTTFRI